MKRLWALIGPEVCVAAVLGLALLAFAGLIVKPMVELDGRLLAEAKRRTLQVESHTPSERFSIEEHGQTRGGSAVSILTDAQDGSHYLLITRNGTVSVTLMPNGAK